MTTLDDVRGLLERSRSGHLATASADAEPHLIPVVYAMHEAAIWIAIDEKPKTTLRLRRLRNIEQNPRAALLVDHYDDDWSQLWWVLLRGAAEVWWPQRWDAAAARRRLQRCGPAIRSISRWSLEERPLLRLHPERVTAWSAQSAGS